MPKKVLVALPPGLLKEVDFVAKEEHRNRSDLVREALRRYIDEFKSKDVQSAQLNQSQSKEKTLLVSMN